MGNAWQRGWLGWTAVAGLLLTGLAVWHRCRERIPEVPLGVEHAVAMRYKGPEVTIKSFRRGVDVNVRLERMVRKGDACVYDFRYILNQPGLVDISTYLAAADGGELPGLPVFRVRGVDGLPHAAERRILETEHLGIEIRHGYYEGMATAIVLWFAGLLLLVFWRPRRTPSPLPPAPVPLQELLRELLGRLRAGALDVAGRARLEKVMLHCWRAQLAPSESEMLGVVQQVEGSATSGAAYRMMEEWLHNPAATITDVEVIDALAASCAQPATGKEA